MSQNYIPQEFQPLLPSSSIENLDPQRDKKYIIEHLLRNATMKAWYWMLNTYKNSDLQEVICQSRQLHERDVMIWIHYLGIDINSVLCLQKKSQTTHSVSWNY